MNKSQLGRWGEEIAANHLAEQGYRLLERNVRTKHGEIDLVMLDGETLVFVEVKTRSQLVYGTPAESVTRRKQHKLRELALDYLRQQEVYFRSFRFDVCAVLYSPNQLVSIQHIPYAF